METRTPATQRYGLQSSTDLRCWRTAATAATLQAAGGTAEVAASAADTGFFRLARETGMFRFGPEHRGLCDAPGPVAQPKLKWKFKTGEQVFSSPAVVGGVVFIGSVDTNFYALDAATGGERWRFRTAGAIRSSPAVVDGTVYFSGRDGLLYALNANTGAEQWRCRLAAAAETASVIGGDLFDSSPTMVDGVVYIGSADKRMYAIDAVSGQPLWSFLTTGKVRSTPAVAGGLVHFGGLDGYAYALDTVSGTNLWRYRVQGRGPYIGLFNAPAVVDGIVYYGCADSAVYALDAATGKLKWRREVGGGMTWVHNSPAVADGVLYAGTSVPGYLCALETGSGRQRWAAPTPAQPFSSPALSGGLAYYGTGDITSGESSPGHPHLKPAALHAVNLATGKEQWRFATPGQVFSSPAVVDGVIYFGCLDGHVYAVE